MKMQDYKHIAMFLGKRIAVQVGNDTYRLLYLYGIFACNTVIVGDRTGHNLSLVNFDRLADPYMLLTDGKEIFG
jgi:hypothetical protein